MDEVYSFIYTPLVHGNAYHKEMYKIQSEETTDTGMCRVAVADIVYHLCGHEYTPCNLSVFYSEGWLALSDTIDAVNYDVDS